MFCVNVFFGREYSTFEGENQTFFFMCTHYHKTCIRYMAKNAVETIFLWIGHIKGATFLECCIWVCRRRFWRLRECCCHLWCCCRWHQTLRRAIWPTAKVLSLQLGVSLKPLQNSRLTLLYCRHKRSAELTATGNQQQEDETRGCSEVRSEMLGWRHAFHTRDCEFKRVQISVCHF